VTLDDPAGDAALGGPGDPAQDEAGERAGQPTADRPLPPVLRWLGLLIFGVVGALSAAFEILLIPFRIQATLVPVAVLLAVLGNIVLPRMSRRLTGTTPAALPPLVGWFLCVATFVNTRREGDVLLPGGGNVQYVSYGVMLAGMIAGVASVITSSNRRAQSSRTAAGSRR
jgi:hypothetical protein